MGFGDVPRRNRMKIAHLEHWNISLMAKPEGQETALLTRTHRPARDTYRADCRDAGCLCSGLTSPADDLPLSYAMNGRITSR